MLTDEAAGKPSSPSFQLLLSCTGKEKYQESNTTDSLSTNTVVRQTTAWRWVIVFGSFCVHFVADGVLFSFGILMHVIKDDLKIELHTVGIIASLFVSLPLFLAPLSSALVNKYGCRVMTMLGGFLCSMGLLFASLVGNFVGALIGIGITCGKKRFHYDFLFQYSNRNWFIICLCSSGCYSSTLF
jgi:MFS family permease